MPWVKIDDQFFSHPKIIDLSKDAKLLHLASLTYAAAQLTDGKLTPGAVRVAAAMVDVDRACVPELVKAGLWEEIPDGYEIHDYLEYNPTAEEVKLQRQENARRQAEWRERKKATRNKDRNAVTNAVTNEEVTGDVTDVSQVPRTPTRTPSPQTKDKQSSRANTPLRALPRAGGADAAESVVLTYCEEMGFDISEMTRKERKDQRGYATELLNDGFSQEEIIGCIRYAKTETWRDSPVHLGAIRSTIGPWKRSGCPSVAVSRTSQPGRRRKNEPDYSGLDEFMETMDRLEARHGTRNI